ncbi:MAG: hypothetical protein H0U84_07685 [Thermoleophilaceae bacterium]|nr:hypothetical protein [Thermoleophilaceae bacterium]
MEKLVIDPVVRAILGPSQVSQVADMREHTDAVCVGCGGPIRPEDPAPATVVLGVSEDNVLYIRLAHERCAPSQVYDIAGELHSGLHAEVSFVAYPILRAPPVVPRAMIVFELARTVVIEELGGDQLKQSYVNRGWEPVTDTWDRVTAASVDGLCVRLRDDQIVVDEEDGEIIAFSNATAPPGWWEAGTADGCLLLYGSGLGLDRFSFERLNTALQASACAAATALVDLSEQPARSATAEEPEAPVELLGYAHALLVTRYFATRGDDPVRRARKQGLSAAETADRLVAELRRGPEGARFLQYVEANQESIGRAITHAVRTGDAPGKAVSDWVRARGSEAFSQIPEALRRKADPP